jgi:hypothetical protein
MDLAELWRGAVAKSDCSDHPLYDTLFIEWVAYGRQR